MQFAPSVSNNTVFSCSDFASTVPNNTGFSCSGYASPVRYSNPNTCSIRLNRRQRRLFKRDGLHERIEKGGTQAIINQKKGTNVFIKLKNKNEIRTFHGISKKPSL
ncbi:hypothetical protein [Methanolapillus africanus]|uniref:hypothetical protein n=1 Tax=Methanolapillus africanus TaxID=3028297 RepID=UPI0030B8D929